MLPALLAFLLGSCSKNGSPKKFFPTFTIKVNGRKQTIPACGSSDHVAQYLGDTAVFIGFSCGGQGFGLRLKGRIPDGRYVLGETHRAWYEEKHMMYHTDSLRTGWVTIRSGTFGAANGMIPYVEGEIVFDAIDTLTGSITRLTEGRFLLKKY